MQVSSALRLASALALCAQVALLSSTADAQEPAACLSADPSARPPAALPYFLVLADTSGSTTNSIVPAATDSCGYGTTRNAHERCALRRLFSAYGGTANFGLGTMPRRQTSCGAGCFGTCAYSDYPGNVTNPGCGAGTGTSRRSLSLAVPIQQDNYWTAPPSPSNVAALLQQVDNVCTGNTELFADGFSPINGVLRDAYRYLSSSFTALDGSVTHSTPLTSFDRPCRSVNVLLIIDGDETCDSPADAVNAATQLATGFVTSGITYRVRVHVVAFGGGVPLSFANDLAAAGGTGTAYVANDEAQLTAALSTIVASARVPERCDNVDNDCNGCTDDGSPHYCYAPTAAGACCSWATPAQRTTCLSNYRASITPANPTGNTLLLPCITPAQASAPTIWLCEEASDACDNVDNDCDGTIDEGTTRCGSPLRCPSVEICNAMDDDCDGVVDDGVCGACVPMPEVCDGCDNDCDGTVDDGAPSEPCGLASPAWCSGVATCRPSQPSATGACVPGAGLNACSNAPSPELCNGIDEDCDTVADDGVASTPCIPAGAPSGLVYGGASACVRGATSCMGGATTCLGWIGPSSESCNGIDDDCDGVVDDGVFGVGAPCGSATPPCTAGVTACVSGALVCQGGTGAAPEICDGVDNDCDGTIDDAPLADAPADPGCWDLPGNCCSFGATNWCPPPGATCNGSGGLASSCGAGTLGCAAGRWACGGARAPSAEICDGLDNDCSGAADDGALAEVGQICGSSVGECSAGVTSCVAGVLSCASVGPTPEVCNGLDDDCNGSTDDRADVGTECAAAYDAVAFPGARVLGACVTGLIACDAGGAVCAGSVGPAPELCDGVDNDCDGEVDETGAAPDGVDGTASPIDPEQIVGMACGAGACGSAYACARGEVVCGTSGATLETCNCLDDDCDGAVDEDGSSLCGGGACAALGAGSCACVTPCADDAECAVGASCAAATESGTGTDLGLQCVPDGCVDCAARWIESSGIVTCAPEGTELSGCVTPPVCTCTAAGCGSPCTGVVCDAGEVCAEHGPSAGTCITPACPDVPCNACGTLCVDGACVDDPCDPSPCAVGSTCTVDAAGEASCSALPDGGVPFDGGIDGGVDGGAGPGVAGGCACRASGGRSGGGSSSAWWLALALGAVLVRRRSRLARSVLVLGLSALIAGCPPPVEDADTGAMDASADAVGADAPGMDAAVEDGCVPVVETCNGRDDDCNGLADDVDETALRTCGGCGNDCTALAVGCARDAVGCAEGACVCSRCAPGYVDLGLDGTCDLPCSPTSASDEVCNGLDDDCDGQRDEDVDFCVAPNCGACGADCVLAHAVASCTASGPDCAGGDASCVIGACTCTGPGSCFWDRDGRADTGCEYACDVTNGGVEICDGLDNDCDGVTDTVDDLSGDPTVGAPCSGGTTGLCADPAHRGVTRCLGAVLACEGASVVRPGDVPETCNGVDDDCDGVLDDAPTDVGGTCGTSGVAPCALGRWVCSAGALACRGSVEPAAETCNGRDDDCNGSIDDAVTDVGGACNVPVPPPPGATSACRAGTSVCSGGRVLCAGATGPASSTDACGVDSNCDGRLTGQPDFATDVRNCGACGDDCYAGTVRAVMACVSSACVRQGCQPGFYDLDGNGTCEYACSFTSSTESCNGIDDDCDGMVDDGVVPPAVASVCGTRSAATAPECTSGVSVACTSGAWRCTFPAGVCAGGCSAEDEICDGLDNDCDGFVNENTPAFGMPCASDAGLPAPGHGACRTTGTYVCAGPTATVCSAVAASCATLPGGCTEVCDGIDNDCDGVTDEPYTAKGANASFFVRPTVTRVSSTRWVFTYEASRPGASVSSPGFGNGYHTSAPAGTILDRTRACSVPSRLPWTTVTPTEAEQTCTAIGGFLCSTAEWQTACTPSPSCTYGYAPRGTECSSPFTASRFCNLGPSYDFSAVIAGDQDGLLVTASPSLAGCYADWSGLQGNTGAAATLFDLTGNVREITRFAAGDYRGMGGSYASDDEAGAACGVTTVALTGTSAAADLGFRCCFSSDPTL